MLPCGNINPLGITGTPAIDDSRRAIYLDGMVLTQDGPQHLVFGLSLEKGHPPWLPSECGARAGRNGAEVYPERSESAGALLIIQNTVYIPYGGHFGDCGHYHGWVVGVSLDEPHRVIAWSTRAAGGGIWAPGGVVSDGHSLFAATGNTFDTPEWGGGEAVIRLGFDLKPPMSTRDYFAASDWRMLDRRDADLGGTSPLPFDLNSSAGAAHLMLALGKDGKAYVLNRDNLGGVGGGLATRQVSSDEIKNGPGGLSGSRWRRICRIRRRRDQLSSSHFASFNRGTQVAGTLHPGDFDCVVRLARWQRGAYRDHHRRPLRCNCLDSRSRG